MFVERERGIIKQSHESNPLDHEPAQKTNDDDDNPERGTSYRIILIFDNFGRMGYKSEVYIISRFSDPGIF